MIPFIHTPHCIGRRGRGDVDDKFRDKVAHSMLRGVEFIRAHKELKMMTNVIFCQAGFSTIVESPNIFHSKVPSHCIQKYINIHQLKDSIIPGILIHNHPNDTNSAGIQNMTATFDKKTLRIDKNETFYAENRINF